jgi:flagellar protein FlgJ
MDKGIALDSNVVELQNNASLGKLKRTCLEFESIFLTYLLKSMRNTLTEDGLLGNSNESKIFNAMFDENLALGIATGGGVGLGAMLFEQLKD